MSNQWGFFPVNDTVSPTSVPNFIIFCRVLRLFCLILSYYLVNHWNKNKKLTTSLFWWRLPRYFSINFSKVSEFKNGYMDLIFVTNIAWYNFCNSLFRIFPKTTPYEGSFIFDDVKQWRHRWTFEWFFYFSWNNHDSKLATKPKYQFVCIIFRGSSTTLRPNDQILSGLEHFGHIIPLDNSFCFFFNILPYFPLFFFFMKSRHSVCQEYLGSKINLF